MAIALEYMMNESDKCSRHIKRASWIIIYIRLYEYFDFESMAHMTSINMGNDETKFRLDSSNTLKI